MSAAVPNTATVVMPGPISETQAVAALAALAQPARLRVFRALVGAGPEGMTPGVLAATLAVPSSTLSFHLKGLADAGLVQAERQGRHLVYRPLIAQMNELIDYLTNHCCGGQPCGLVTPSSSTCC
ncbi:MAG: ArsR/SmtB family transcription factor [Rubrivivax sp.]